MSKNKCTTVTNFLISAQSYLALTHVCVDTRVSTRVFHENMFFKKKNKRNPPRISLGVGLKESKRIFWFWLSLGGPRVNQSLTIFGGDGGGDFGGRSVSIFAY